MVKETSNSISNEVEDLEEKDNTSTTVSCRSLNADNEIQDPVEVADKPSIGEKIWRKIMKFM